MLARYGPWIAWGMVLWGVLKIGEFPWPTTHDICGPWGCGPPVTALIACHGAWLVIFTPLAYVVPALTSWRHCRRIGWLLQAVGMLGILGMGLYELAVWLPAVPESVRTYFGHRWAFSVVTLTDVPLVQSIVLGTCLVHRGRAASSDLNSGCDGFTNRD